MDWRTDFLAHWEKEVAVTRDRLEMLKDGRLGLFAIMADGRHVDQTADAIAREEATIAALLPLLDRVREELSDANRT